MNYDKLTVDQRKAMIEARLLQYEQEHFSHDLNEKLLTSQLTGKTGEEQAQLQTSIAEAQRSKEILDAAHAQAKKELGLVK